MEAFLATFLQIAPVLYVLGAAAILDLVTGAYAAYQSGNFNAEFLPTFFTSNVLKKIVPIFLGLLGGFVLAGTSAAAAAPVIAVSATAAAAYLAAVVKSIVDNISEGGEGVKSVPTSVAISAASVPAAPPISAEEVTSP